GHSRAPLAERRRPRRVAARRALGLGMALARGRRLVLQIAPARACRSLGLGGGGDLGLGRRYRLLFGLDLAPHGLEFGLDIGEAGLSRQTARPAPPAIGGARQTLPAPTRPPPRHPARARAWPRPDTAGPH